MAKDRRQAIEAELTPKLIEHPDIAEGQGRFEAHLRDGGVVKSAALGVQKITEHGINLATGFIDATERGEGALAGTPHLAAE